ncbi:MAG: PAS domain S-box protein, partial [Thermoanaerobaculia bacterium]
MENNETNGGAIEILVAEDSPTQSAQLVHLLETRGYAVVAAKNGREALARFEERTPSLVITDVMMPEMDGFGLCRAIKATPEGKSVPVVLLTTLSDPEDVIRGLETGADNFIRKPYEEKYLLSRIDYLLMNQRMRRGQRLQIGVELNLGGERHFITSERQQILDLLISTYEQAVQINNDLKARERELGETNAVVNALYRLAEELNRAGSESEVLEGALERAMRLPFVQSGWILLRDGDAMRVAASRNLPPALATAGAFEGACTCTRLCLSGELESVTNVMECERLQTPAGDMLGFRHHAAVPLWLGDRVLGVMNLVGHGEGAVGEEELRTLYNIGNQVAVALDRARLRGHLERVVEERTAKLEAEIAHRARAEEETALRARREAALAELGRVAVTGAALEDFFDEACWIVSETLGADIVKIAECEGGGVVVRAGKPMRGMGPLSDPAQIDFVLASDEPVVVADYTWDSRFRRSPELERERIASSVSVAIRGEDGPFGLISAFSKKVGAFPPGSELFVRAVADLIAAAVSRRRAEESLHESESLLQIASRVARVGAWTIELPDMSMTISDEIRAIYEMPADWEPSVDEAIGFCAPEHQDLVRSAFRKCAEEGTPYDIEMQLITARERRIWVRSIGEADRDASGTIRRVHGAFQDISERKEAVENTRALAERLTRTLESVADTFYTLDREYRFTYLNAAGEKLLQRPREELLGRNIWELFPDTLGTLFHEQYRRAMEEEVPVAFEFFYEPLDLWVDMRAFPSQEGLTIFARDITEQKRARQTIEESEERFRLLFDKNPYPAWVYDLETLRFLAVNEAAVRQYGWSREEFLGMTIKDIRPPETIPDVLRSIEERPNDRTPLLEGVFTHLKKDGTAIDVEIASSPITLFGRPARLILATDVTERRRMEQQFLRAQRMESIGTLASGIAHDLNNLLMPVMMGVTLLR